MILAEDKLAYYRRSPLMMVRELFGVEPDFWQQDVLNDFPHNPAQAMACCKGPGKTAVIAWLCWNFLLTRMHPKIGALSITGKNLHDNLWPEMAKWQKKSPLLDTLFEWANERIFFKDHPETWFMSAKAWPQSSNEQQMGEVLAGLWADHVMFVLDEAGGIPIPVMRTAEAVLGTARTTGREAHILMAGNTTSTEGCLYEAVVTRRHLWKVYEITADPDDPKRTPRIDRDYARQQIQEYGRDNPWVMVNILARFPSQGFNALIGLDEVKAAIGRHLHRHDWDWAPRILGGDPARFGDDRAVLFPRQGLYASDPLILRGLNTPDLVGHWAEKANDWEAHSIQVDAGEGAGVIDGLRNIGFSVQEIPFSSKPRDPKFFNKRAEIWWEMCDWIRSGASLPSACPEIIGEITSATYGYKQDKIIIEEKKLMKARLGRSPDLADALACTFAFPVALPDKRLTSGFDAGRPFGKSLADYDPLSR